MEDLEDAEGRLTIDELVRIRELYGATHYVTTKQRVDLADRLLYATTEHAVYDVTTLTAQEPKVEADSP